MSNLPHHLSAFCNRLGVSESERTLPIELVVNDAFLVEIREHDRRFYLCGQLNEIAIASEHPVLERFLEDPMPLSACGFPAYESSTGRLLYWSEILPGPQGMAPKPDLQSFLREMSNLCKKVSLEGLS